MSGMPVSEAAFANNVPGWRRLTQSRGPASSSDCWACTWPKTHSDGALCCDNACAKASQPHAARAARGRGFRRAARGPPQSRRSQSARLRSESLSQDSAWSSGLMPLWPDAQRFARRDVGPSSGISGVTGLPMTRQLRRVSTNGLHIHINVRLRKTWI